MLVTYRGQRFKVIPPYLSTLINLALPKSSLAWGCTVWISVAFSMVQLTTIRAKWSFSIWLIAQDLEYTAVCDTYSITLFHLSKECYRWKQAWQLHYPFHSGEVWISRPSDTIMLYLLGKTLCSHLAFPTLEYRWALENHWADMVKCWGVNFDLLASHPMGNSDTLRGLLL